MKVKFVIALFALFLFIQAAPIFNIDGVVNLNELYDYESDIAPSYVEEDWTPSDNLKSNIQVTLGRVLFYDKKLSLNETVACASCHQQEFAFGDPSVASEGFDGQFTKRHAPRLVNIRHRLIPDVFWDGRVDSLENQPAMALTNSVEMGFSGTNGQPGLDSLISRLNEVDYYKVLSDEVFGDEVLTIERVEKSIAQFVSSIVSYDSKLDEALAMGYALNDSTPDFPNYSNLENYGKSLFFSERLAFMPPNSVVPDSLEFFHCNACHAGPNISNTFAFGAANNGVIGVAGNPQGIDLNGTNPPSLRNMFTPDGDEIGPFMHDGSLEDLTAVLKHYSFIPYNPNNRNFTVGFPIPPSGDLNQPMSEYQVEALIAFLKTLSGTDVFTNPKWSDPFNELDELVVIPVCTSDTDSTFLNLTICEGEEIEGYTESGIYSDLFMTCEGCDSLRTLELTVLEGVETIDSVSICEGDIYNGYTVAGTYVEMLIGNNGCDSISNLVLEVLPESDPNCMMSSLNEVNVNDIFLSPNPAVDLLNIDLLKNSTYQLQIYSLTGQLVFQQEKTISQNSIKLNLENIGRGSFVLVVKDIQSGLLSTKRFVKL